MDSFYSFVFTIQFSCNLHSMKFSLASFNSSFSECVRKHHIFPLLIPNEDNPSCPEDNVQNGRCVYNTKGPTISGTNPFIFTDTDFLHCSNSGNGGAIAFSISGGTLTITRCLFSHCISYTSGDNGNGGGAIHSHDVATKTIFAYSSFSCACYSFTGFYDGETVKEEIISQPNITECYLILCLVEADCDDSI